MLKYIKPCFIVLIIIFSLFNFIGCSVKRVGQSPSMAGGNLIDDIRVEEVANKTKVTIAGHIPPNYTTFKLANPLRIVIDIADANISAIKSPQAVSNETVDSISLVQFDETGSNIGRVEIALKKLTDYRVIKEGNDIVVMIDRVPGPVVSWESMSDADQLEPVDTLEVGVGDVDQEKTIADVEKVPSQEALSKSTELLKVEETIVAPKKDMPKAKALTDFKVEKGNGYLKVVALGDGSIGNYNAFRLGKPDRLVVDIFDIKNADKRKSIKVNETFLKAVRIGQHANKVRMVLDIPSGALTVFNVEKNSDALVIVLGEKEKLPKQAIFADSTGAKESVKEYKESVEESKETVVIDAIKFTQMPESSRIIISAEGQLDYKVKKLSSDKIAIDLMKATIPKNLQRSLDTSEFHSPVALISSYQLRDASDKDRVARVVVSLNKDMPYKTSYENGSVYFDIERDVDMEARAEDAVIEIEMDNEPTLIQTEKVEQLPVSTPAEIKVELSKEASKELVASVPDQNAVAKVEIDNDVYNGQRISLDYKDADINNVLRLFAEVSGFNVIAADDVKGTVTVKLHDVPWDQAFDIVLDAKGLGMVKKGNVIRVAPASKLKKEEEEALAANAVKEKLVDLSSEIIPVSHAPVSEMAKKIGKIKTDRGSITIDERSSLLIIRDVQRVIDEARLLIIELDKPTPQVLIEARIVEVDTNHKKDLGVQWGSGYTADAAHGNPLNYGFPNSVQTGIGLGGGWGLNAPNAGSAGTGTSGGGAGGAIGFSFGSIDNTISLDLKLSALESQGVSKIISKPRIVTINKQEAKIQQGLSIPFVTTSAEGTKTEFVDASLELKVTPEVKQDKSIILNIHVSKNEPDFARASGGAPSIAKKEAMTSVMINDGDTTVIGGIFTQKKGESESGVPVLSKIPLIGWLFRSTNKTLDRAELLIFITARIVVDIK
ncbi:MAG: type IV pilus secretin PilQ [bacterium]|nr:type IV pilus secretin PilQ [bacterium]